MYRESHKILGLKQLADETSSDLFKEAVGKLSKNEQSSITNVYKKHLEKYIDNKIKEYKDRATDAEKSFYELNRMHQDCALHKGFYDTLKGNDYTPLNSGSIVADAKTFIGIREAVEYLQKPDQTIQHLQDPNPKDKDYNHRYYKDRG